MSLHEEVELLRHIPLFANIEPSKLKLLAFTSERKQFAAGQVLFRQGEDGDAAYILMEGRAEICIVTDDGSEKTIAEVKRNDIVGEIAILCDVPRTATVRALEPLTTLRISKDLFFRLIGEFPQIAVQIMRDLAKRLDKTTHQLRLAMAGDL